eukprot:1180789-Prorocentrum_minimum.AAC.4
MREVVVSAVCACDTAVRCFVCWCVLQLDGSHLIEPELRKRFLARYPEKAGELTPPVDPSEQRALSGNNMDADN